MKIYPKWMRFLYITGIVALILGALDPLEGSVLIALGSVILAIITRLTRDRDSKIFQLAAILILTGVFFLFYLSSKGGFGGESALSWWWTILIIPYPVGWVLAVWVLIRRAIKRFR